MVAEKIRAVADSVRAVAAAAKIIVAGDFNDYAKSESVRLVCADGFTDVSAEAVGQNGARATYKYHGEWRSLDHILVSTSLLPFVRSCRVHDARFLLTDDEKRRLCRIVSDSGADFIKTSTGFSTGGATREDVALLRACCDDHVKVKAAGGIKTLQDAEDFINLGAERLGTSRIVKLAIALEQQREDDTPEGVY